MLIHPSWLAALVALLFPRSTSMALHNMRLIDDTMVLKCTCCDYMIGLHRRAVLRGEISIAPKRE